MYLVSLDLEFFFWNWNFTKSQSMYLVSLDMEFFFFEIEIFFLIFTSPDYTGWLRYPTLGGAEVPITCGKFDNIKFDLTTPRSPRQTNIIEFEPPPQNSKKTSKCFFEIEISLSPIVCT